MTLEQQLESHKTKCHQIRRTSWEKCVQKTFTLNKLTVKSDIFHV